MIMDPRGQDNAFNDEQRYIINRMQGGLVVGFCHMYRSANKVAHSLARYASFELSSFCWKSLYLDWLNVVAKKDISLS